MHHSCLAAVRLTRKAVSLAVFHRTQLEYARTRFLRTSAPKARDTLEGFLAWTASHFNIDLIAIEKPERNDAGRVEQLALAVEEFASRTAIPLWRAPKMAVIQSYAEPAPSTRTELRAIAAKIWPMLADRDGHPLDLEAAALGLHVQVERQLTNTS